MPDWNSRRHYWRFDWYRNLKPQTRYKVLYTDLNREDAKAVMSLMDERGVNYLKEDDGRTIKVPEEQVNKWRMEIATLGINFSGTVGYEVFDKQSLERQVLFSE